MIGERYMMRSQFGGLMVNGEALGDDLMDLLYAQMFMVAYAKMRNKSDALDVVQESWIKIISKIDTLREADKLVQWSKVIAANTANNLLRKRYLHQEMLVEGMEVASGDHTFLDEWLLAEDIRYSLQALDGDTRQMFEYKYFAGWKDKQIAEKMGYPIGTVKARIHRGKDRLRTVLRHSYPD